MSRPEFNPEDLQHPIYGVMTDAMEHDDPTIIDGVPLKLGLCVVSRRIVKPVILVDQVGIHQYGAHLETFSGIETTDPECDYAWVPGKRISGVWNHLRYYFVFLTEVDGQAVAQEDMFYNTEIDRTGQ